MKIDFAARVDIGPKETNDDRILVANQILDQMSLNGTLDTPAVAIVCDGCGGYAGGGIAAQTVLELLSYEAPESLIETEYLTQVLANCEQAIADKKLEMPQYSAMCTTIAGCVFGEENIVIFHAGDSRVYRYTEWGLAKMTVDHSAVQDMINVGLITEEEALVNPSRNVINRCLGADFPPPEIKVEYSAMKPREKYIFCSDGLWEGISQKDMVEILKSDISLTEMADALVDKAKENGVNDNISVCICTCQGEAMTVESQPFILD